MWQTYSPVPDKPAKREDVTYERSVAWNEDLLFNFLELRNITVVLQDWGGLIGLRTSDGCAPRASAAAWYSSMPYSYVPVAWCQHQP